MLLGSIHTKATFNLPSSLAEGFAAELHVNLTEQPFFIACAKREKEVGLDNNSVAHMRTLVRWLKWKSGGCW